MSETSDLKKLLLAMRQAFFQNRNAMELARTLSNSDQMGANSTTASLVAYDLQAGSYIEQAERNPETARRWHLQLAEHISPFVEASHSLLEVGCGEATTLSGVVASLAIRPRDVLGFDISWSRIQAATKWLAGKELEAKLFVGDLFSIPLADDSIDVVYTSHSLEPNGGREQQAIRECLRVSRGIVVLIEPIYEMAAAAAQERMTQHGYVKGLRNAAESLGASVLRHELLPFSVNALNPSGVLVLEKVPTRKRAMDIGMCFQCPLTGTPLRDLGDVFFAKDVGIAYPVIRGVPLLRAEHAVVASALESSTHLSS